MGGGVFYFSHTENSVHFIKNSSIINSLTHSKGGVLNFMGDNKFLFLDFS